MRNIYQTMYSEKNKVDLAKNPRVQIMLGIINNLNLENKNILDIGCYDGTFLSFIKNQNNNFYGLDASDYGVAECLKRNIKVQKFFWDDKTPLPCEDNFFDLIVAGEIIEHIFDTDYFLLEIARILKAKGKLVISTPNIASLGRRLLLLWGRNPLTETSITPPNAGHIRYFTLKTMAVLLQKYNFKIIQKFPDIINFSNRQNLDSKTLAKIFPGLCQSIIYLAEAQKHKSTENTENIKTDTIFRKLRVLAF